MGVGASGAIYAIMGGWLSHVICTWNEDDEFAKGAQLVQVRLKGDDRCCRYVLQIGTHTSRHTNPSQHPNARGFTNFGPGSSFTVPTDPHAKQITRCRISRCPLCLSGRREEKELRICFVSCRHKTKHACRRYYSPHLTTTCTAVCSLVGALLRSVVRWWATPSSGWLPL